MVGGLRCVIIHVKCDPNRSRGYGTVGVENGPFLLLWPVAYTTACTTVQAVITATSISYGKMETLTSCKIETLEQIDTQFVRIDYVHERNVFSKFGKNLFTGHFWANGWNITFCVTFYFFSRTNAEKRPLDGFWRAVAQKTRNRARICLFGVIKWKIEIWPLFTPKNLALNRQLPAKMMKHETPSISESTEPIEMKI